jgi:hypothetical protein
MVSGPRQDQVLRFPLLNMHVVVIKSNSIMIFWFSEMKTNLADVIKLFSSRAQFLVFEV